MANVAQPGARARRSGREVRTGPLLAPSVVPLVFWAFVPLAMTLWFSLLHYNLLDPITRFVGFDNYSFLLTDPSLLDALWNTVALVGRRARSRRSSSAACSRCCSTRISSAAVARLLVIAPFFVMPTVSALIWKNLLMHPVYGLFGVHRALAWSGVVDWFGRLPLTSIIIIVSWEWLPFATLILLTAVQSLDREQMEAARMDGAGAIAHVLLHHPAASGPRRSAW